MGVKFFSLKSAVIFLIFILFLSFAYYNFFLKESLYLISLAKKYDNQFIDISELSADKRFEFAEDVHLQKYKGVTLRGVSPRYPFVLLNRSKSSDSPFAEWVWGFKKSGQIYMFKHKYALCSAEYQNGTFVLGSGINRSTAINIGESVSPSFTIIEAIDIEEVKLWKDQNCHTFLKNISTSSEVKNALKDFFTEGKIFKKWQINNKIVDLSNFLFINNF